MRERRFPAPWRVMPIPGGYVVEDGNGVRVAYVYAETNRMQSASYAGEKLTPDEARRIAAGIARLPDLMATRRE